MKPWLDETKLNPALALPDYDDAWVKSDASSSRKFRDRAYRAAKGAGNCFEDDYDFIANRFADKRNAKLSAMRLAATPLLRALIWGSAGKVVNIRQVRTWLIEHEGIDFDQVLRKGLSLDLKEVMELNGYFFPPR